MFSSRGNTVQVAMITMAIAMLIIPISDALVKWLSGSVSAGQVAWTRFVFQTIFLLPLVLHAADKLLHANVLVHIARGATLAIANLLFFSAIKFLPIADAISIFFVEPLLVTLFASIFLKEKAGMQRLLAIGVGLIGVQFVIRPNFEQFGWAAVLPFGAALSFVVYILLTRKVAQQEDPICMQFYAGIFGMLTMTLALLVGNYYQVTALSIIWPTHFEWSLLFMQGVIATVAHLMVVYAFKRASVGILAPFQYIEIIGATILGLLFFGDFPDMLTWFGIAIVIASGLYVFYCERKIEQSMHKLA